MWLVWLPRGLAGVLLVAVILEATVKVSADMTLMFEVLIATSSLGLAAQAAGVAEILRLQIALRNALRAWSWAD